MGKDPRVKQAEAKAKKQAAKEGKAFREKRILRKRQYSMSTDEHEARVLSVENVRRDEIDGGGGIDIVAGGPGPGQRPGRRREDPKPPELPQIIDRFHKWGRNYVTVSRDHFVGDDPIPNPGYAAENRASTIEEALIKARALVSKMTTNFYERCVVVIFGGDYEEDLNIGNIYERIDLVGIGQPIIKGNTIIGQIPEMLIEGITFESLNDEPACEFTPSFSWRRMDLTRNYRAPMVVRNCTFMASHTAMECYRVALFENCYFEQTEAHTQTLEVATVVVGIDLNMLAPVKFQGCHIFCYPTYTPVLGNAYKHWAIKVTAKVGYLLANGGYMEVPGSKVMLEDTFVYGGALVEGWQLMHRGGAVHHGIPMLDMHAYAHIRGWVVTDPFNGAIGQIPGSVHFDGTGIYSAIAGIFRSDPGNAFPHVWGGSAYAMNLAHFATHYNSLGLPSTPGSMFVNLSVGQVYAHGVLTPAEHIYTGGFDDGVGNHTGADALSMTNHYLRNY